jgi:hypothetical protein
VSPAWPDVPRDVRFVVTPIMGITIILTTECVLRLDCFRIPKWGASVKPAYETSRIGFGLESCFATWFAASNRVKPDCDIEKRRLWTLLSLYWLRSSPLALTRYRRHSWTIICSCSLVLDVQPQGDIMKNIIFVLTAFAALATAVPAIAQDKQMTKEGTDHPAMHHEMHDHEHMHGDMHEHEHMHGDMHEHHHHHHHHHHHYHHHDHTMDHPDHTWSANDIGMQDGWPGDAGAIFLRGTFPGSAIIDPAQEPYRTELGLQ